MYSTGSTFTGVLTLYTASTHGTRPSRGTRFDVKHAIPTAYTQQYTCRFMNTTNQSLRNQESNLLRGCIITER
jgi:hypothetical protein